MIPFRTPFLFPLLYPSLIWRMPADKPELYLTFDDGPVSGPTEFVMEQLEKTFAKATFFCIGDNIRKHAEVFKKIIDGGHTVGNHTFNHLNGWKTPTIEYLKNIRLFEQQLLTVNQNPSPLFRPPYGRITRRQIKALPTYKIIMWDVLSQDYNQNISSETILRKTLEATRAGSIIVFHDSFKAEKNLRYVLPRFLDHFAGKGYTFKAISS